MLEELREMFIQIVKDESLLNEWKKLASRELRKYVKHTANSSPFSIKPSNYFFYVDTKSYSYGIEIRGVTPNLGCVKSVRVPVDQWQKAEHPVRHYSPFFGWKTFDKVRETASSVNAPVQKIGYFGASGNLTKFFGTNTSKFRMVYGISGDTVVPAYSAEGYADWLVKDQTDELNRILYEAGSRVIDKFMEV